MRRGCTAAGFPWRSAPRWPTCQGALRDKALCGVCFFFDPHITYLRSPHEGRRSCAIPSARLAMEVRRWPCHYPPHRHAKPRHRQARFRISLSLSRWGISVAERPFARFSCGLFAEQRHHSLSCHEPRACGHARMKTITLFSWKQSLMKSVSIDTGCTHESYID